MGIIKGGIETMEYPTSQQGYYEGKECPECGADWYVVNMDKIECCFCGREVDEKHLEVNEQY
jgi:hypothetical protein